MPGKRIPSVFCESRSKGSPLLERFDENQYRLSQAWSNNISRDSADAWNQKVLRACVDFPLDECSLDKLVYRVKRHTFATKSEYTGEWDEAGITGTGYYVLPHEVEYEGGIRDGMFHGKGTLRYPMGQTIEAEWFNGAMMKPHFKYWFADKLEYDFPWSYCQMPDRRLIRTIHEGLRPAGRSLLTNDDPPRPIPEGSYDTGDGFYSPKTKCVTSAYDPNKIIRVPTAAEERWIIANCRKAWDAPTGYRPDYFERYITGRRCELDTPMGTTETSPSADSIISDDLKVSEELKISQEVIDPEICEICET